MKQQQKSSKITIGLDLGDRRRKFSTSYFQEIARILFANLIKSARTNQPASSG
jgi:hypothetical protein